MKNICTNCMTKPPCGDGGGERVGRVSGNVGSRGEGGGSVNREVVW